MVEKVILRGIFLLIRCKKTGTANAAIPIKKAGDWKKKLVISEKFLFCGDTLLEFVPTSERSRV